MSHTLADIINLVKVLPPEQFLLAVPVNKEQTVRVVHAEAVVFPSPWQAHLNEALLDKQYHLCLPNWHQDSFKPVTQLFVTFDKEWAPLNNNLLVYINGQILWDNVRLAQQSKES